jgi:asparagine synthase (glutamine-hydrolysing)
VHGGGRYLLALDGWLAGPAELHASLGLDGTAPVPDCTLVAEALARWGDAALDRMHGQFAIAWWDMAERRLMLACDRMGGRTLFLHRARGGVGRLCFAGTVGMLLNDAAIPREVDPQSLARVGLGISVAGGRTCFVGIDQLPAGHKLVMTPGSMAVERYWRLDPHRRVRFRRDEEYVEAARDLLDRVVADHLRGAGPVVAMLSGGLDSSAVAATAARLASPDTVRTLTMRPDPEAGRPAPHRNAFQDEWDLARATAAMHANIRAEATPARLDSVEDLLRTHMPLTGRPPGHLLAGAWFESLWRRARALGARAVLAGRTGNATLTATALVTRVRPTALADLPGALADGLARVRLSPGRRATEDALRSLVPPWAGPWLRRMTGRPPAWQGMTGLASDAAVGVDADSVWHDALAGETGVPFRLRWRLFCIEQAWLVSSINSPLRLIRGVEHRDPLGDVRMAEFCLALPHDQFTRGRQDRFLARRVLADRLPAEVLTETRRGRQNAEWHDWMTRLRPWMAGELDRLDRSSLGRELVDVPRLRASLDDWPADADAAEPRHQEIMKALGGGVALGVFLRWAEGGNA